MSSGRVTQLPKRWAERRSPELSVVAVLLGFLAVGYLVLKLAPDWFGETGDLDAKGRAERDKVSELPAWPFSPGQWVCSAPSTPLRHLR